MAGSNPFRKILSIKIQILFLYIVEENVRDGSVRGGYVSVKSLLPRIYVYSFGPKKVSFSFINFRRGGEEGFEIACGVSEVSFLLPWELGYLFR